jgi:uncharacterized protein YjbJ (UPF0337 family)
VTEFLGVLTDDDDTVAKGKTEHAEAIDEAASHEPTDRLRTR